MIRRIRARRATASETCAPDLREPVDGVFEVRAADRRDAMLLGLADDIDYPVRHDGKRALPAGGFLTGCLAPGDRGGWVLSEVTAAFPGYQAAGVAQLTLRMLTERPELPFRNPRHLEHGWRLLREERDRFIAYFGGDTLVLPPAEAAARLAAFREDYQPALDPGARTVGVIYDQNDGLLVIPEMARAQSAFRYPALAADPEHARTLRWYVRDEAIPPAVLRRLAAAHPETADEVFRLVLRRPEFCWAAHGEVLLREHKPGYFAREPRPAILVIGERLGELL
jgi:hypothetical protein